MKKQILVWGTGSVAAMYINWLIEKYDVLAFINNESDFPETLIGIQVIRKDRIADYQYDAIVIASLPHNADSIKKDAISVGVHENLLHMVVSLFEDDPERDAYEEKSVKRQLKVLQEVLNASREDRMDPKWLYRRIIEYGINCFQRDWYRSDNDICWDRYGLMQIPEEFADFCSSLCGVSINTAIEIGVYRGRSAYFMCAVIAADNPDLEYTMVDIADQLDHFEEFNKLLPQLKKNVPATSDDYAGQRFDFVFIDADHSYDGSIRDYNNVGQYARILTVFHDIYAHEYDNENGGTVRMWREVMERTQGCAHRIYSRYPERWMGIGAVETGRIING